MSASSLSNTTQAQINFDLANCLVTGLFQTNFSIISSCLSKDILYSNNQKDQKILKGIEAVRNFFEKFIFPQSRGNQLTPTRINFLTEREDFTDPFSSIEFRDDEVHSYNNYYEQGQLYFFVTKDGKKIREIKDFNKYRSSSDEIKNIIKKRGSLDECSPAYKQAVAVADARNLHDSSHLNELFLSDSKLIYSTRDTTSEKRGRENIISFFQEVFRQEKHHNHTRRLEQWTFSYPPTRCPEGFNLVSYCGFRENNFNKLSTKMCGTEGYLLEPDNQGNCKIKTLYINES